MCHDIIKEIISMSHTPNRPAGKEKREWIPEYTKAIKKIKRARRRLETGVSQAQQEDYRRLKNRKKNVIRAAKKAACRRFVENLESSRDIYSLARGMRDAGAPRSVIISVLTKKDI